MNEVVFFEGRPLAQFPPREMEDQHFAAVTEFAAKRGETVHEGWLRVGLRNGWVSGWHADFAAASGTEAGTAETTQVGSVHEGPTAESGDAQPSARNPE